MGEGELRGLRGHGAADFGDAMANIDDGGLARGIEESAPIGRKEAAAFSTDGGGERFVKMAREDRVVGGHARWWCDCSRLAQESRRGDAEPGLSKFHELGISEQS